MSGGVAYVYDPDHQLAAHCNMEMIELFKLGETGDDERLHELLVRHARYTNSAKAMALLASWEEAQKDFVKVYPKEFHRMNDLMNDLAAQGVAKDQLEQAAFDTVMGPQPTVK
jgi:glutamate synthase (NADPH/NADH) large chain